NDRSCRPPESNDMFRHTTDRLLRDAYVIRLTNIPAPPLLIGKELIATITFCFLRRDDLHPQIGRTITIDLFEACQIVGSYKKPIKFAPAFTYLHRNRCANYSARRN